MEVNKEASRPSYMAILHNIVTQKEQSLGFREPGCSLAGFGTWLVLYTSLVAP